MNITFVLKEFPKSSETFIRSQVERLISQGHRVSVVSLRKPSKTYCENIPAGLERIRYVGVSSNMLKKITGAVKTIFQSIRAGQIKTLRTVHNLNDFILSPHLNTPLFTQADAVIVHFGDLAYWYAGIANAFNLSAPFATVFHGVDVARYLPGLSTEERAILWQTMSIGLPVSEFWRNRLIELGCPTEKLTVHHMGIDPGRFHPRITSLEPKPFTLVTVCRLVEKKGIDTALHGLAGLEYPDMVRYIIIGDGPEHERLTKLAHTLGIDQSVEFLGALPQDQVAYHLDHAHAFVLTSKTASNGDMEGIPVSLMEAMACGLPVISTHHSGIPELVENGVSGLLVDENDGNGVTSAINRLMDNPDFGMALGKAAHIRVKDMFNSTKLAVEFETILASMNSCGSS